MSIRKNVYAVVVMLIFTMNSAVQAQPVIQTVSCDTYMDAGPLDRASSFDEEQVVAGVYQGLAQQYNSMSGQLKSVIFYGRVNPASGSASNTVKVIVYNANQGLPGTIIGSQNVVLNSANIPYQVTAVFASPLNVSGSIIISIEPFSPTTDNFFVQRNVTPDGQFLNLTKIKQANQWFKNLAAGDPAFDYDFIILPVKAINLTASFTNNTVSNLTTFTNTSINGDTYEWNFGDGATSVAISPAHNYASSGTYNVKLKAFSSGITTCVDSVIIPVNVIITSINDLVDNNDWLHLDNNLVGDELTITAAKSCEVTITDFRGARIAAFSFVRNESRKLNISSYQPGIYYVNCENREPVKFIKVN